MIVEGIRMASDGRDLTRDMARAIMDEMMSAAATPSQVASFVTAMRMKGETKDELVGLATAMRSRSKRVDAPDGAVDLCGTGGDGASTFNISTTASFVVAAAGVPVAKHGNRAISSRAGSADVLAALGVPVDMGPGPVETCLRETSIGFMYAPLFHESMRNVMATRREIGIRTFFNILGPLANPAGVRNQLIGVFDQRLGPLLANVMKDLGAERAMVVHGSGLDEVTNIGPTRVVELADGEVSEYDISPDTFGLDGAEAVDLAGGSATDNARTMLSVLRGESSPRSDVVAMNSAAALYTAGKARSLEEGFETARETLSSGAALDKLRHFADTALALEEDSQRACDASALSGRRVLPATLRHRCDEIAISLADEVASIRGGEEALRALDPGIVSDPTILSVLVLNRLKGVLRGGDAAGVEVSPGPSLSEAIGSVEGVAVVGEYKPRSPLSPPLSVPPSPEAAAEAYSASGVAAVSVLGEPDYFHGGPDLFADLRARLDLPMLFKDFIATERHLELARSLGADAVLLIAKALGPDLLAQLVRSAVSKGMEPLVEVHDREDLAKLKACAAYGKVRLVGINSRDLRTMRVDLARARSLRDAVGDGRTVVAESGLRRPSDVALMGGFDAVLIGSMFMGADDLERTVAETVGVARGMKR